MADETRDRRSEFLFLWDHGESVYHGESVCPFPPKRKPAYSTTTVFFYHMEPQRQAATSGLLFLSHIVGQMTGETFEGGCEHTHMTTRHNSKLFASATMKLRTTSQALEL